MKAKRFSVWVGAGEVNDCLMEKDDAMDLAEEWAAKGYDDVYVMDCSSGECFYVKA